MEILATIVRDEEGYLLNVQDWNLNIAYALASEDNLTLTQTHLDIIHLIRSFYLEYQAAPTIRALLNLLKEVPHYATINSMYLQQLFPNGPARQALKIAGLPKPIRCI